MLPGLFTKEITVDVIPPISAPITLEDIDAYIECHNKLFGYSVSQLSLQRPMFDAMADKMFSIVEDGARFSLPNRKAVQIVEFIYKGVRITYVK